MLDRVVAGEVPVKHHTALRDASGALRHEQCITRDGFLGPYTIAYHVHRPHTHLPASLGRGWSPATEVAGPGALAKRLFRPLELSADAGPAIDVRTPLLFNEDVVISTCRPAEADPVYFANHDGDDLYFVYEGSGVVRSALGDLNYESHDYICVPKGILHRFVPDAGVSQCWLSMECLGGVGLLSQCRNETGQLRMDAPYGHRDFRRPEFRGPTDERIREIVVKRDGAFHGFKMEHSPLDVVGWDGTVYPWAFPILAFQPRVGSVHIPPDWHGTFAARGALICSFVPRVLDFHPEAIPCPYPHTSVDCDEVLFYVSGDFTSRRGVGPGCLTLHPAGLPHGPHPGAYEASVGATRTEELAVMLDTTRPLRRTSAAARVEDADYMASFQ